MDEPLDAGPVDPPEEDVDPPEEEDVMDLLGLAVSNDLSSMKDRLATLPPLDAVIELLERAPNGGTALHNALAFDAPLELVRAVVVAMEGDPRKTNLFIVIDENGDTPLHFCATYTTRVDVIDYIIAKWPHSLLTKDKLGNVPFAMARDFNCGRDNHPEVLRVLEEKTAKFPAIYNQVTVKCCMNEMKKRGMTELVSSREVSDLTRGQFVFMVLDNMVNREMKAMAEDILSYVGTNNARIDADDLGDIVKAELKGLCTCVKELQGHGEKRGAKIEGLEDRVEKIDRRLRRLEVDLKEQDMCRKQEHKVIIDALAHLMSVRM
jgi:hypothetical protein